MIGSLPLQKKLSLSILRKSRSKTLSLLGITIANWTKNSLWIDTILIYICPYNLGPFALLVFEQKKILMGCQFFKSYLPIIGGEK